MFMAASVPSAINEVPESVTPAAATLVSKVVALTVVKVIVESRFMVIVPAVPTVVILVPPRTSILPLTGVMAPPESPVRVNVCKFGSKEIQRLLIITPY
jgi:hypothetical protein